LDDIELDLIDGGAEEIEISDENVYVYTAFEDFGTMQSKLEELGIEVKEATLQRFPQVTKEITEAQKEDIEKLIEKFEDDEDVQKVFHNMG
jgi:transcriptional/translational regulatory protein YebC/TACO1